MNRATWLKRVMLFSVSLQILFTVVTPPRAHAGLGTACWWLLGQRQSPWLSRIEKWQRKAKANRRWRPPAQRYYPDLVDDYDAATNPLYWYVPGNRYHAETMEHFPQFVREYQASLGRVRYPDPRVLQLYVTYGPDAPVPGRRRLMGSRKKREKIARERDLKAKKESSSDGGGDALDWQTSAGEKSESASEGGFKGQGGSGGGAGASDDWGGSPSNDDAGDSGGDGGD